MSEAAYGREFAHEAMHQLDQVMVGREDAKAAGLVTMVAGVNGAFSGGTGRAKTELMLALPQLVVDVYDENVAQVPVQNDLTGIQLVGGTQRFTRNETDASGNTAVTEMATAIPGVLKTDTQVLNIDEGNRIPSKALAVLLGALESRKVALLEGTVDLSALEWSFTTVNPRETQEATQPLPHALISRISTGAIFARGDDKEERIKRVEEIGELSRYAKVEPITDLATIHRMRETAQGIEIPASLDRHIAEMSVDASDALWEAVGLDDGEERLSKQVRKIARVITVLEGETSVQAGAVNNAMEMAVAARVGLAHHDAVVLGPRMVQEIVGQRAA